MIVIRKAETIVIRKRQVSPQSAPTVDDRRWPDWVDGMRYLLAARTQFVLSGNIRDMFRIRIDEKCVDRPILDVLWEVLADAGYHLMLVYDAVDGLRPVPDNEAARGLTAAVTGEKLLRDGPRPMTLADLCPSLRNCVNGGANCARKRIAVVIDYASRIPLDPQHLTPEEREFFLFSEKLANEATLFTPNPDISESWESGYNPIVWLVNRELDLPIWFAADNPKIHSLVIPLPNADERKLVAKMAFAYGIGDGSIEKDRYEESIQTLVDLTDGLPLPYGIGDGSIKKDPYEESIQTLVDLTDGLPLSSIDAVMHVAKTVPEIGFDDPHDIAKAIRIFKLGVHRNPWAQDDVREKLRDAKTTLLKNVIGQTEAVRETIVRLQRAVMGLSSAHISTNSRRPRAVLLFAGPTGVGKTELVRAVTHHLFGTEDACVRFDMSEFSSEHADQRLLGAPPGYVGYDAGGELTNAVRGNPFRMLLFDEIEKAHPRILDKFLQILEDGRLTDGRGNTVYFSESVIFFTTNLGMSRRVSTGKLDEQGRAEYRQEPTATADTNPSEMRKQVRLEIERHFKEGINRPELLNRIGENIIVFDFIRERGDVSAILDGMLNRVADRVKREHKLVLNLSAGALKTLLDHAQNLARDFGGRGIGNAVEVMLVNPLASQLFDSELFDSERSPNSNLTVAGINRETLGPSEEKYELVLG